MGLFYEVSPKKLLETRNDIFVKIGIPALEKQGFQRSPFTTDWFGRNNLKDFTYTLCRVNAHSHLEIIKTHISRGDRWIKVFLNIFELTPKVTSLDQLKGVDGLQYHLPPNSITEMRLRVDDFKGMPLFRTVDHKIKSFYTERGFQKRVESLGNLIGGDLTNINRSVEFWHSIHNPLLTDWEGKAVK